jgi:hypothetical protein
MLEEAARYVLKGQNVCVVAANFSHAKILQALFYTKFHDLPETRVEQTDIGPLTFQNGNIRFEPIHKLERELGLPAHEFDALGPFEAMLIDHFTIESEYGWVIKELHRWDAEHEEAE